MNAVLTQHSLPVSDEDAVLSWARPDADAQLWALLLQALGAVHAGTATTDQTNAADWLTSVYNREAQLSAQDAGLEYTKWAGLGINQYYELLSQHPSNSALANFLGGPVQAYADGASYSDYQDAVDGGYCVYQAPSPDQSQYTSSIFASGASATTPQQCYTSCTSFFGCPPPTPTYTNFTDWGAADANDELFGSAQYSGDIVSIAEAGTAASLAAVAAPTAGAITAAGLGSVLTGSAFQTAVFPFSARVSQTAISAAIQAATDAGESTAEATEAVVDAAEVAAGEIAATGVGAIVSAIIFAVVTAVQEGLNIFTAAALPGQLANYISQAGTATNLPNSYASDDTNTMSALYSLFVGSTEPDPTLTSCDNSLSVVSGLPIYQPTVQEAPCLNATPIPAQNAYDPQWVVTPRGGARRRPRRPSTRKTPRPAWSARRRCTATGSRTTSPSVRSPPASSRCGSTTPTGAATSRSPGFSTAPLHRSS